MALKFVMSHKEGCVRSVGDLPGLLAPYTRLDGDVGDRLVTWAISDEIQPPGPGAAVMGEIPTRTPDSLSTEDLVDAIDDENILATLIRTAGSVTLQCLALVLRPEVADREFAHMLIDWNVDTTKHVLRRVHELMVAAGGEG